MSKYNYDDLDAYLDERESKKIKRVDLDELDSYLDARATKPKIVKTRKSPDASDLDFTYSDIPVPQGIGLDTQAEVYRDIGSGVKRGAVNVAEGLSKLELAALNKAGVFSGKDGLFAADAYDQVKALKAGRLNEYNAQYGDNHAAQFGALLGEAGASAPFMFAGGELAGAGSAALSKAIPALQTVGNYIKGNWLLNNPLTLATKGIQGAQQGAAGNLLISGGSNESLGDQAETGAKFGAILGVAAPAAFDIAKYVGKKGYNALTNLKATDTDYAMEKILQNANRDQISLEDARDRIAQMGNQATLADIGGENLLSYADTLGNVPGRGKQTIAKFLNNRQEGQGGRVINAAAEGLGVDASVPYHERVGALDAKRIEESKPFYDEAKPQSIPVSEFNKLVRNPVIADAINSVKTNPLYRSAIPEINFGPDVAPYTSRTIAASPGLFKEVAENPYTSNLITKEITPAFPSYSVSNGGGGKQRYGYMVLDPATGSKYHLPEAKIAVLDVAKQNIDDQISAAKRAGEDGAVKNLMSAKSELLDVTDKHVPVYKEARAAYAGPSQSIDAAEMGRAFMKEGSVENEKAIAKLSDVDKGLFREGVMAGISDIVKGTNDGADAVKRIYGSPAKREILQSVFPTKESFDNFIQKMENEKQFFISKSKIRAGSPTQPRLSSLQDAGEEPAVSAGDLFKIAKGNYAGAALNVANKTKNLLTRLTPERAASGADLMFSQDQGAMLNKLLEYANRRSGVNAAFDNFGRGAAGQFIRKNYIPVTNIATNKLKGRETR